MPEYRPAPELVRAHEQLTQALIAETRRAQTSANLRGTEVLLRVLPLLDGILGFAAGVQGDVVAYAEQLASDNVGEAVFGIDEATFDDLSAALDDVRRELAAALVTDDKQPIHAAMERIEVVRSALEDLVIDDGEEEGDDDELEVED